MYFAGKERLHGAALGVDTQSPRCGIESDAIEVREKSLDRFGPGTRPPADGVPDPHARAEISSDQRDFARGVNLACRQRYSRAESRPFRPPAASANAISTAWSGVCAKWSSAIFASSRCFPS